MAKTVKFVKNSLKFKAQPKTNVVTVKVGLRRYTVPVEARMLGSEGFLFLSLPSVSELYKVTGKSLAPMGNEEEGSEAFEALNPVAAKKRGRKASRKVDVPDDLKAALTKLPSGHKLVFDKSGGYKLVRTRKRG